MSSILGEISRFNISLVSCSIYSQLLRPTPLLCPLLSSINACNSVRSAKKFINVPEPGKGIYYRYRVKLPDEYTIAKIPIQKLGGRDPETGRVVVGTVGGGSKQKFRWVDYVMRALPDGSPRAERVLFVVYDPLRTCMLSLVGHANHLRYIIAHSSVKVGDVVTTYQNIPLNPVKPKVGDSHPLGALPIGTEIFNIEVNKNSLHRFCINGGTYATIVRKLDTHVVIQLTERRLISVPQQCMCTVGHVLPRYPPIWPIGSAQRRRHLGLRSRSGLYHKKDGRYGRKLKKPPPMRTMGEETSEDDVREKLLLNVSDETLHHYDGGKLFCFRRGIRN